MSKEPDKYIENIGCEECGSSDALGVYERADGSYHGKCFACNHHTNEPYGKEETKIEGSVKDGNSEFEDESSKVHLYNISDSSVNRLSTRGISKDTCELYGVRSILSDSGIDVAHFYPHTSKGKEVATAIRVVDGKKFSWIGSPKDLDFFGQSICGDGGKMIIVTEGVCDCLAAKQMLLSLDKNYRVVSLVNGAGAAPKDFKNNYEWINKFESIFLAFDQDEPGQKAAGKVAEMFSLNKVKNMIFSEKDPNALLLSGKQKEFLTSIFDAKGVKVEGIVSVKDLIKEALEPDPPSTPYPWNKLNEVTLGFRTKELILVGASPGAGKSQLVKEIAYHTISVTNNPIGLVFLEESPIHSLKGLASIASNKRFTLPRHKGNWSDEDLAKELEKLEDKVFLFKHFGAKGFDEIKLKISYMARVLGVKVVIVDHITALIAGEINEYTALNKISEEIASLAYDLDITIFLVSHLRKSSSGKSFSEGAQISTDSFRGSGSLISWSHLILALSRDQGSDDERTRNTSTLSILKSRFIGEAVGFKMQLYYDKDTGRMIETDENDYTEFDEGF